MLNPNRYLVTLASICGVASIGVACGNNTAGASACAAAGASCIGVGDCGVGVGLLGAEDCGAQDEVCCYPLTVCPASAEENFGVCCTTSAAYRPVYINEVLACQSGQTQTVCAQIDSNDNGNGQRQCPAGLMQLPAVACPLNMLAVDSCQ